MVYLFYLFNYRRVWENVVIILGPGSTYVLCVLRVIKFSRTQHAHTHTDSRADSNCNWTAKRRVKWTTEMRNVERLLILLANIARIHPLTHTHTHAHAPTHTGKWITRICCCKRDSLAPTSTSTSAEENPKWKKSEKKNIATKRKLSQWPLPFNRYLISCFSIAQHQQHAIPLARPLPLSR